MQNFSLSYISGAKACICKCVQELAEELLTTVRKTESSLKRLKKVQQLDGVCAYCGRQL